MSALAGAIVGALATTHLTQKRTVGREHLRAAIEVFWLVAALRDAHRKMVGGRGGAFQQHEVIAGHLADALRNFAAVSAELGVGEREKAMEVYRALVPLTFGGIPEPGVEQDIVGGPMGRLVDAYPEVLAPLLGDAEVWQDFQHLVEQHQGAPPRLVHRQ